MVNGDDLRHFMKLMNRSAAIRELLLKQTVADVAIINRLKDIACEFKDWSQEGIYYNIYTYGYIQGKRAERARRKGIAFDAVLDIPACKNKTKTKSNVRRQCI
jgi:hypothetical protein